MQIREALELAEQQGYFEKVAKGDHRASGLFVRLVAWWVNPDGNPTSWGALRKTGGGANVDGYSEDALVKGNDPLNFRNVVDFVVGAGRAGASINYNANAFVARRSSDVWEAPRPLTTEELAYLNPDAGPIEPPPVEPSGCKFMPVDLAQLTQAVQELSARLDRLEQREQHDYRDQLNQIQAVLSDFDARFKAGLKLEASARFVGGINGTVKG